MKKLGSAARLLQRAMDNLSTDPGSNEGTLAPDCATDYKLCEKETSPNGIDLGLPPLRFPRCVPDDKACSADELAKDCIGMCPENWCCRPDLGGACGTCYKFPNDQGGGLNPDHKDACPPCATPSPVFKDENSCIGGSDYAIIYQFPGEPLPKAVCCRPPDPPSNWYVR